MLLHLWVLTDSNDLRWQGTLEAPQQLWSPAFVLWVGTGLAAAQTIGLAEVSSLPIATEPGGGTPAAVLPQVIVLWPAPRPACSTAHAAKDCQVAPPTCGRSALRPQHRRRHARPHVGYPLTLPANWS